MCSFELGDSRDFSLYLAGVDVPLSLGQMVVFLVQNLLSFTLASHTNTDSSVCLAGFCQPLQSGPIPPSSSFSSPCRDTHYLLSDRSPGLTLFLPQKYPPCSPPVQIHSSKLCSDPPAPDFPMYLQPWMSSLDIYFLKHIIWPSKCFRTFLQM